MANDKTWLLWLIPVGCVGVILLTCGGCVMLIVTGLWGAVRVATNNQAYKDSVAKIQQDPRVLDALGEPIEIGWGGSFHVNSNNSHFKFPISGSKASGDAIIDANANNGQWTVTRLDVVYAGGQKTISLLPKPGIRIGDGAHGETGEHPGAVEGEGATGAQGVHGEKAEHGEKGEHGDKSRAAEEKQGESKPAPNDDPSAPRPPVEKILPNDKALERKAEPSKAPAPG